MKVKAIGPQIEPKLRRCRRATIKSKYTSSRIEIDFQSRRDRHFLFRQGIQWEVKKVVPYYLSLQEVQKEVDPTCSSSLHQHIPTHNFHNNSLAWLSVGGLFEHFHFDF